MIEYFKNIIRNFLSGNKRSVKVKKNIILSLVIKGLSVLISLIYVPLLLDIFDAERYGVWLTISSMVVWFNFLDLGLGSGFRNKFAEAIAVKNTALAREYVSTIYISLAIISTGIIVFASPVISLINWNKALNTTIVPNKELVILAFIVFASFSLRFVFQLIGQILSANQRPALNNSFNLMGNILSLGLIFFVGKLLKISDLPVLAFILSMSPILVLVIASVFFFHKDYRQYTPSIRFFRIHHLRSLLGLGINFFFIQISMVVIMYSTNFLIAQFCSPKDVTVYNVAQKLFSVGTMMFTILLTPMWSAITEAFVNNEYAWIKNAMRKLRFAALISSGLTLLLLLMSKFIFHIWIGNRLQIPFVICLVEALRTITFMFFGPYASFLNGVSKVRLNVYLTIFSTCFYIPLAYFMSKNLEMGIIGILLAGLIIELPLRITQPIQYYKILNHKATGIWNR
jgi:O-antigen/teichoic acid export membrane protein